MKAFYTLFFFLFLGFYFSGLTYGATMPALQSFDQYSRIQIPVANASSFRLVSGLKTGEGDAAELTLEKVSLDALTSLNAISDSRVKRVIVKPMGADSALVRIILNEPKIESFAYLQSNPSVIVLDLWPGKAGEVKPVAQKVTARKIASAPPSNHKKLAKPEKKLEPEVVRVEPLTRERDLFQKFVLPMPPLLISKDSDGYELPPSLDIESHWKFQKGDNELPDGLAFNLAQRLFQQGKYGLVAKTIEIALRDTPNSKYKDEMGLLNAFSYKKLGENNEEPVLWRRAEVMMAELAAKKNEEGNSVPFQRLIKKYFGFKAYEQKDWLKAIDQLEFVASGLKDKEFPYIQAVLAEAYIQVNEPRRAERIYRYLLEHYPKHLIAKESAYRIADLLAVERNFQRMVEAGEAALSRYPEFEKNRSETIFNLGEASFWLKNYRRAEKYFKKYTEIASAQPNAALAFVRLGEISEIESKDLVKAHDYYLQAKNGYPFSLGDKIALVRLARLDVHVEKEPEFIVKRLGEILEAKDLDWDLRRMADLVYVDYLVNTGLVDEAVAIARRGMRENEGVVYEAYKRMLCRTLFEKFKKLNSEKYFSEALAFYEREKRWLDESGAESMRELSISYKGLGLYDTSNLYLKKYAAAVASKAEGNRSIASLSGKAALNLTQAKNSFARGSYGDALQVLPEVQAAEVFYMRSVCEQKLGRKNVSLKNAEIALRLNAREKTLSDNEIEVLSETIMAHNFEERNFAKMEKDLEIAKSQTKAKSETIDFSLADAIWLQRRHEEAVKEYKKVVEDFPKSNRVERARYREGLSLIGLKKHSEAVSVLTDLKDSAKGVWADSASRELELLEWEKKYSNVLRTLPPSGLGIEN